MTQHATFSASGAAGWMRCPGKLFMEKGLPNTSSVFADEGTAAHEVASLCLEQGQDASAFAGRIIKVEDTGRQFEVDADMVEHVQTYLDYVRSLGGDRFIEQRVDFSDAIEVPDSFGTADCVVVLGDQREIAVVDLKYGRGVEVSAEQNEQLQLYGLGALGIVDLVYDIEPDWIVRLVIVQPRIGSISEWTLTVEELQQFGLNARIAARHAKHQYDGGAPPKLEPGEKQCRWCLAKATCPALAAEVRGLVTAPADLDDFADLDSRERIDVVEKRLENSDAAELGRYLAAVDLVELWCKAVRAEAEHRLFQGEPVPGFKLVQGRRGARKWSDAEAAEAALKAMRLKAEEMYDRTLISPTSAEKLFKAGAIGKRQWPKLEALVVQSEGSPSVAPVSDKRPAITVAATAEDFDDLGEDGFDLA